jgi:hypothetical protein
VRINVLESSVLSDHQPRPCLDCDLASCFGGLPGRQLDLLMELQSVLL